MGVLAEALRGEVRASLSVPPRWLREALGAQPTAAGIPVTPDSSMGLLAVFAAINLISEDVAGLPLPVYRRLQPRGRQRVIDHPVARTLNVFPNPEMTAFTFRQALTAHRLGWGNGYAEINRLGDGTIWLWPLIPRDMKVVRNGYDGVEITGAGYGEVFYVYRLPDGTTKTFERRNIFHLHGLSYDGRVGYSPIHQAREEIAGAMAVREFGNRVWQNDARPGVVLKHPGRLSDPALKRLKKSWDEAHRGLTNAQRVAVLEEGMDLTTVGIPPAEAQFIESRNMSVLDIARLYRLAPHKLSDFSRATFSNIEESNIDYVVATLRSHAIAWEQQAHKDLMDSDLTAYPEHLFDALLRGNTTARWMAYEAGWRTGTLSPDDIREKENLNPLPDGKGDIYYVPMNYVPAKSEAQLEEETQAAAAAAAARRPAPPTEGQQGPAEETPMKAEMSAQQMLRAILGAAGTMQAPVYSSSGNGHSGG